MRAWREPNTCFVLARRNYKAKVLLGKSRKSLIQQIVVIDTGAGSNFIRRDLLSEDLQKLLKDLLGDRGTKPSNFG